MDISLRLRLNRVEADMKELRDMICNPIGEVRWVKMIIPGSPLPEVVMKQEPCKEEPCRSSVFSEEEGAPPGVCNGERKTPVRVSMKKENDDDDDFMYFGYSTSDQNHYGLAMRSCDASDEGGYCPPSNHQREGYEQGFACFCLYHQKVDSSRNHSRNEKVDNGEGGGGLSSSLAQVPMTEGPEA